MKSIPDLRHDLIANATRLTALARIITDPSAIKDIDWERADLDCANALETYRELWQELRAHEAESTLRK